MKYVPWDILYDRKVEEEEEEDKMGGRQFRTTFVAIPFQLENFS